MFRLHGTEAPVSGACGKNELGSWRNGAFRECPCSLYRGRRGRVLGEQESISACCLSNVSGSCEIEDGCSGGLQGSVPDDGGVGEADAGIVGLGEVLQGRSLENQKSSSLSGLRDRRALQERSRGDACRITGRIRLGRGVGRLAVG